MYFMRSIDTHNYYLDLLCYTYTETSVCIALLCVAATYKPFKV